MSAITWRRIARGACALAFALAHSLAAADDAKSTLTPRMRETRALITRMTDPRGISAMKLSPDGKTIAVIAWTGFANALLLIDSETNNARTLVAPERRTGWTGIIQPWQAHWISDDSLAVDFNDGDCAVVGFDGRRGRVLGARFVRMIAPAVPGERSQWALVQADSLFGRGDAIHRVNVVTGESTTVPLGLPGDVIRTVFDHSGHLRAATTQENKWLAPGAKNTNWYRHDENSPWQQIAQASVMDDLWVPIGVPDDSDKLVILSREGRDTLAMFSYDVATRRTTDLLAGHPAEDLVELDEEQKASSGQDLIRVMLNGLKPAIYWFDSRWNQLQASVDQVNPDTVNILSGNPHGKVLVASYSDRDPGRWQILDTTKMTLHEVSRARFTLDPAVMRPMQTLTYPATDGLPIPTYLTLPAGPAKPGPMVVYIHGGPVARDQWAWEQNVQLLAAAGYAVFQPQFRGSSGFGHKFEVAGYRQWGLAMQDDVTAGVQAMIAQGVADPARICIYGASYGGYAALWGLVKTPELYQCGVSLAGVTDIGELFSDWSDTNEDAVSREARRFMTGDIHTMAAQFDAVSPEKHAAQIRVPVLLAHGTDDRRVPIGHSKRMAAALNDAHRSVETHWYDGEGHGFRHVQDTRDFDVALLDFLDRNIGPTSRFAAKAAAATAAASAPAAQP